MKFRLAALAALAALAIASGAAAAAEPTQSLGVSAGAVMATGPWTEFADRGFQFGGSYFYRASDRFGVGAEVAYQMPGEKSASADQDGARYVATLETHVLQGTLHAKLFAPVGSSGTAPYVRAGFGLYGVMLKSTLAGGDGANFVSFSDDVNDLKFGFDVGLGVLVATGSRTGIGIEARYQVVPGPTRARFVGPQSGIAGADPLGMFTIGISWSVAQAR